MEIKFCYKLQFCIKPCFMHFSYILLNAMIKDIE